MEFSPLTMTSRWRRTLGALAHDVLRPFAAPSRPLTKTLVN
jgi:hypothetical protein